jgi:hypothetical protein
MGNEFLGNAMWKRSGEPDRENALKSNMNSIVYAYTMLLESLDCLGLDRDAFGGIPLQMTRNGKPSYL